MCVPPVVSEALLHRHVGHVEHHIARPPRHSSVQILPVEAQQGLPSLRAAVKGPPHFLRAKFLGQCGPVSPPEIQPIWIKGQVVAHVQRLRHRARQFLTARPSQPQERQASSKSPYSVRTEAVMGRLIRVSIYLLPVLKNGASAAATPLTGMVWSRILPGPVTTVLNRPSPPKRTFLTPFTI